MQLVDMQLMCHNNKRRQNLSGVMNKINQITFKEKNSVEIGKIMLGKILLILDSELIYNTTYIYE
jgi:hypothetical protein